MADADWRHLEVRSIRADGWTVYVENGHWHACSPNSTEPLRQLRTDGKRAAARRWVARHTAMAHVDAFYPLSRDHRTSAVVVPESSSSGPPSTPFACGAGESIQVTQGPPSVSGGGRPGPGRDPEANLGDRPPQEEG